VIKTFVEIPMLIAVDVGLHRVLLHVPEIASIALDHGQLPSGHTVFLVPTATARHARRARAQTTPTAQRRTEGLG
jgi:hypothetical protein